MTKRMLHIAKAQGASVSGYLNICHSFQHIIGEKGDIANSQESTVSLQLTVSI